MRDRSNQQHAPSRQEGGTPGASSIGANGAARVLLRDAASGEVSENPPATCDRAQPAALVGSKEHLQRLFEALPLATYAILVEPSGHFVEAHASVQIGNVLDLRQFEPSVEGWLNDIDPEDRQRVSDAWFSSIGKPWQAEYRMTTRSGRTIWIHDQAVPSWQEQPKLWLYEGFYQQISAGAALAGQGGDTETALADAGRAMRASKTGSHAYDTRFLDPAACGIGNVRLLAGLGRALGDGTLRVRHQPEIDLRSGACTRVGASLYWHRAGHGWVPPSVLMPLVEQNALAEPIARFALNTGLRQLAAWRQSGIDLAMGVGIPARVLLERGLPETVATLLTEHDLPGRALTLEITESDAVARPEHIHDAVARLQVLGVRVALTAFGSLWHSAFAARGFDVDELAIEAPDTATTAAMYSSAAVLKSMTDLAHDLGLVACVSGVKNRAMYDLARAMGSDYGRGAFISKPLVPGDVTSWLGRPGKGGRLLLKGRNAEAVVAA